MAFTEEFHLVRPRQNLSILPKPPSPYANPDEIEDFLGEVLVALDVNHDSALAVQEGARIRIDDHFLYELTREEHHEDIRCAWLDCPLADTEISYLIQV